MFAQYILLERAAGGRKMYLSSPHALLRHSSAGLSELYFIQLLPGTSNLYLGSVSTQPLLL